MPRGERGGILLEAVIALAVLGASGAALLALVTAAARSETAARERERGYAAAERIITASALLDRADLVRRIGQRAVGDFLVDVQRPDRALFRIAVADRTAAEVELLVTVVHRPEEPVDASR